MKFTKRQWSSLIKVFDGARKEIAQSHFWKEIIKLG